LIKIFQDYYDSVDPSPLPISFANSFRKHFWGCKSSRKL